MDLGLLPVAGPNLLSTRSVTRGASLRVIFADGFHCRCRFPARGLSGETVLGALLERVGPDKVDVVMSDMAPNMSGTQQVDQARAMYLVELALDMCNQVLSSNGSFVVKVFQGKGLMPISMKYVDFSLSSRFENQTRPVPVHEKSTLWLPVLNCSTLTPHR